MFEATVETISAQYDLMSFRKLLFLTVYKKNGLLFCPDQEVVQFPDVGMTYMGGLVGGLFQ